MQATKNRWTQWLSLLPLLFLIFAIFTIEANKSGFFQTYIRASSYLIFALSILGIFFAYKLILSVLQSERNIGVQARRIVHLLEKLPSLLLAFIYFLKYPAILLSWLALYQMLIEGHQNLLLSVSGYPEHILFPCSDHILWTEGLQQEALDFWKMKWFSEFDCDGYPSVDDKW